MTIAAAGYESKAIDRAIAMVAGSASWRTFVGAADAAAAKAFIVDTWSGYADHGQAVACNGTTLDPEAPWAMVSHGQLQTAERGVQTFDYDGSVTVTVSIPTTAGDDAAELIQRARNLLGSMRDEIQAQFGATDCLARGTTASEPPALVNETTERRDYVEGIITITYRG